MMSNTLTRMNQVVSVSKGSDPDTACRQNEGRFVLGLSGFNRLPAVV